MSNKIRITADDIGACKSIDEAVEKLIAKRVITDISVFINSELDLNWIFKYSDIVNVGLHLTLSFNKPVSNENLGVLLHPNGKFVAPAKPENPSNESIKESIDSYLSILNKVNAEKIKNELLAQYNKFVMVFGKEPAFINVHHDLDKEPSLKKILLGLFPMKKTRFLKLEKRNSYQYWYHFLPENILFDDAVRLIYTLISEAIDYKCSCPNSEVEVVFHPAFCSPELIGFSTYAKQRETEYKVLSTQEIKELVLGNDN